jgi:hypothetical protein
VCPERRDKAVFLIPTSSTSITQEVQRDAHRDLNSRNIQLVPQKIFVGLAYHNDLVLCLDERDALVHTKKAERYSLPLIGGMVMLVSRLSFYNKL